MQLLTTSGYKNIEDCQIGEQLIAYEVGTGNVIINELLGKEWFSPEMFQDEYSEPEQVLDEEGNPVYNEEGNPVMTEPVLIKTKEQIFQETYGDLTFRKINDKWNIFKNQSIWANLRVVHGQDLQIGDIIYNDKDEDVEITSIVDDIAEGWWRLSVSGDHSYIADDLTLHNASRYWVGGGSSANWNATGNTNWGSTSGGSNNASVPTSADDVTFDGAGTNGNTNSTISATITILSLNITAGYTATMTHNAVLTIAGNWTFRNTYTIAGTSGITISAASTITSNGTTWPNALTFSGTNTKTLSGNLTVSGLLTISGTTTLNKTASETITLAGGMTISATLSGTADVYLTGGTWSGTSAISNNLYLNGNITISGTVRKDTGLMSYISGTVNTTGSTINIVGVSNLNTSPINWNNVIILVGTITLTSNLNVYGTISYSGAGFSNINKTTSEVVNVYGTLNATYYVRGTADYYLLGGSTWTGNNLVDVNLYINGNCTVSSTVAFGYATAGISLIYQSGTVTTTGSTLRLASTVNVNVNTNGVTWNNVTFTSVGTCTVSLLSNFLMTGLLTISNSSVINTFTSSTLTTSGGMTISATLSGTADVYLTGGTWSGTSRLSTNLYINGNVTISGTVTYQTNTMNYVSGTVTTTGSTLSVSGSCTLNTNGITWNNITFDSAIKTVILTSNLSINGLLTSSGSNTINKTTSETITVAGGMTLNGGIGGTAKVILTGGTWSASGTNSINTDLDFNGNVTISGVVYYRTNTITYISGIITTTGSTLNCSTSCTLNTNGITWNNFVINGTATLTSNLLINGSYVTSGGGIFNKTTSETVTINGGITANNTISGTADFYLTGGTWSGSNTTGISNNLYLNGDIIISGNVYYRTNVLTYLSGKINSTIGTLNITASATMIGFNKCPLRAIVVTAGQTLTCNALPSGTPSQICTISSSSASNYNIVFQDNFEKMGRFVAIRGANISRPLQLLVTTNAELNTNRSTNGQGIRYYNQSPNGLPRNRPSINDTMTAPAMGLVSDPNFIKQ